MNKLRILAIPDQPPSASFASSMSTAMGPGSAKSRSSDRAEADADASEDGNCIFFVTLARRSPPLMPSPAGPAAA
jgi:hypothetical protein